MAWSSLHGAKVYLAGDTWAGPERLWGLLADRTIKKDHTSSKTLQTDYGDDCILYNTSPLMRQAQVRVFLCALRMWSGRLNCGQLKTYGSGIWQVFFSVFALGISIREKKNNLKLIPKEYMILPSLKLGLGVFEPGFWIFLLTSSCL